MQRQKFLLFRVYRFQDSKAYGELYDLYFSRIRRYVFFKLPSAEDAQEVTSEVFLRGWEYATASRIENANAFFYRIARNLVADFYRSRHVDKPIEEASLVASSEDIAGRVETKQETDELIGKLKNLRTEYQEVLVMKYLDEMSVKEIALALEKTQNNVRVLLHRAKKALQEQTQKNV
ncbi:RNA polymerase sigma factor [Patescibacteria group bacterium]|nr:RNA polymerase sigma factor [Patescibacteria group bacterium]